MIFVLFIYNILFIPVFFILLLPKYLWKMYRRGNHIVGFFERLGFFNSKKLAVIKHDKIWVHAVSLGEMGIAIKFIRAYKKRNPTAQFIVSTTTNSGLEILKKEACDWLIPITNPIDFPILTSWNIKKIQPKCVIFIESDFWINRIMSCKKISIPVITLNTRISVVSQRYYYWFRWIMRSIFRQMNFFTVTEESDIPRFLSIGMPIKSLKYVGNIKYDISQDHKLDVENLNQNTDLFLAASTHSGEESELIKAFLLLRVDFPKLKFVIVPRHIERRYEIESLLKKHDLSGKLRSREFGLEEDILILDTVGELRQWYQRATVVFVGKSLPCSINKGGQNMIEVLQASRVVLVGNRTENFEPIATQLENAGALLRATNAEDIYSKSKILFQSSKKREEMIKSAQTILLKHQGAIKRNCELVEEIILKMSKK